MTITTIIISINIDFISTTVHLTRRIHLARRASTKIHGQSS